MAACSDDDEAGDGPADVETVVEEPTGDTTEVDAVTSFQAWVDENDPDADWVDAVTAWVVVTPRVFLEGDFDVGLATEACEAAMIWIDEGGNAEGVVVRDADAGVTVEGADGACDAA